MLNSTSCNHNHTPRIYQNVPHPPNNGSKTRNPQNPRQDYKDSLDKSYRNLFPTVDELRQEAKKNLEDLLERKAKAEYEREHPPMSDLEQYIHDAPLSVHHSLAGCQDSAIMGQCKHGHTYAKVLNCGKEYCVHCGQKDSNRHKQRAARVFKRAFKFRSMGYLVIQWPRESRPQLRTKKAMAAASRKVVREMKELGYDRGYRAWHYFGDVKCPNGCQDHGKNRAQMPEQVDELHWSCPVCDATFHVSAAKMSWNPHLNLLFDGAFLKKEELEKLQAKLRKKLKEPQLIINYQYVSDDPEMVGKKIHMVKYITRATFRSYAWDRAMADELHGFRGLTPWGSKEAWATEDAWSIEGSGETGDVIKLEDNQCIECKCSIQWYPDVKHLEKLRLEWNIKELDGGYMRLEMKKRPIPRHSRYSDMPDGAITASEYLLWRHEIEDKLWDLPPSVQDGRVTTSLSTAADAHAEQEELLDYLEQHADSFSK